VHYFLQFSRPIVQFKFDQAIIINIAMETANALAKAYKRATHKFEMYWIVSKYHSDKFDCLACKTMLINQSIVICNQIRAFHRLHPESELPPEVGPFDCPEVLEPPHTCGTGETLSIAEAEEIQRIRKETIHARWWRLSTSALTRWWRLSTSALALW
jgi:hypothetical protein